MEKHTEEAMIGDTLTREGLLGLILEERSMEKKHGGRPRLQYTNQ